MGELADKHKNGQHPQLSKPTPSAFSSSASRPPPVPAKDTPGARPISQATSQTTTAPKRGPGRPPKRTRYMGLPFIVIECALTCKVIKYRGLAKRTKPSPQS